MTTAGNTGATVGYLGPAGTFTEQVLLREADLASGTLVPFPSMADVLFAVHDGDVDLGVVPIENAIEGTVNATIDTMAFDVDVLVQRELV
ncbi:MAG: prephenate dehydratase domain-containing protein, partial [Actinomycetes bacterium]